MTSQIKQRSNNKGFSLVELVIVIAIMAVLIAVLAPQFIKYVEQSRISADKATIDEVVRAVNAELATDGSVVAATLTDPSYELYFTGDPAILTNAIANTGLKDALASLGITYDGAALRSKSGIAASIELHWDYTSGAGVNTWKFYLVNWPTDWGDPVYASTP
jgi:type IV pilus assembly protein PilA